MPGQHCVRVSGSSSGGGRWRLGCLGCLGCFTWQILNTMEVSRKGFGGLFSAAADMKILILALIRWTTSILNRKPATIEATHAARPHTRGDASFVSWGIIHSNDKFLKGGFGIVILAGARKIQSPVQYRPSKKKPIKNDKFGRISGPNIAKTSEINAF